MSTTDERTTQLTDDDHLSVSCQVALAVADYLGADVHALEPIYDAIDPDALDRLFARDDAGELAVRFEYQGCSVAVDGDRSLRIL